MPNGQLPKIYGLDEVAEHLHLSRRAVLKIAKPRGLCMQFNETYRFEAADIESIKAAMRVVSTPQVEGSRARATRSKDIKLSLKELSIIRQARLLFGMNAPERRILESGTSKQKIDLARAIIADPERMKAARRTRTQHP